MLRNNNEFQLIFNIPGIGEKEGYNFYIPAQTTEYHTSRLVEASNQQIYANAGANAEVFEAIADDIILRSNTQMNKETFRSDVAILANQIKYRKKYPVDQHCAIRMGAILSFIEEDKDEPTFSEDPNKVQLLYQQRKETLAFDNPELYTFFLTWGSENIPIYKEHFATSIDMEYFSKRMDAIRSLTLLPLKS